MIVSLGQTPRSLESIFAGISPAAIHEAINYALGTVRVVVTPTGDPWRVSQSMFSRMVDLALQKLAQLDPASAGTISRAEMGRYIIERGYISSAPLPVTVQEALPTPVVLVTPVVPTMPTVIVTPVTYTPPIHTLVIQPIPTPIVTPTPTPRMITVAYASSDGLREVIRQGNLQSRVTRGRYGSVYASFLPAEVYDQMIADGITAAKRIYADAGGDPSSLSEEEWERYLQGAAGGAWYIRAAEVTVTPIPTPTPAITSLAEADSNTALWIAGAVIGGMILGSISKGRGGRYARR